MVADHALAHCTTDVKRHGRGDGLRVFVLDHKAADLRPVAVREHDAVAFFEDVGDVDGSSFNHFKLCLRSRGLSGFLKRVSTKGDHDFVHRAVSFFMVIHVGFGYAARDCSMHIMLVWP